MLLIFTVIFAGLVVGCINGFHDSANSSARIMSAKTCGFVYKCSRRLCVKFLGVSSFAPIPTVTRNLASFYLLAAVQVR